MKISLAWLFDHVAVNKKEIDEAALIKQLGAKTVEIDAVERISLTLADMFVVRVITSSDTQTEIEVPETKKKHSMPARKDAQNGLYYFAKRAAKKNAHELEWLHLSDLGSSKEGLMSSIMIGEKDIQGGWRNCFENEDTILVIENSALTHRPDLWGHRGFAREVAALLEKELIPEDQILASISIKHYSDHASESNTQNFSFEIVQDEKCSQVCRRLAGFYIPSIEMRPSLLWMAVRLARVDMKPIDALVDMTNYVMCDIGQPMHAFDAERIGTNRIQGRCALKGEKIKLLDGDEVTLEASDYVITNGNKPLAVAGVMGGSETAVLSTTRSLLLEAANFEPTPIRRTAVRLKKRTDSSTRFEKGLDPNNNTNALLRYIKLLDEAEIPYQSTDFIVSVGPLLQEKRIVVSHAFIENKLGLHILESTIAAILKKLGFGIEKKQHEFHVTVPTFRAKDITIPDDIVEEVARFVGYSSIVPEPPTRAMIAFDTTYIERKRTLKHILAYGLAMHEAQSYAFYDEEFIRQLSFDPTDSINIANPLSEHWQRLVTSLVPHLLKSVVINNGIRDSLRFFELNRVWFLEGGPVEVQECAGIWYERSKTVDFYEGKALLTTLFNALKVDIRWQKPQEPLQFWYDSTQTAQLYAGDRIIGRAGKCAPGALRKFIDGDAFIFELDAQFLLNLKTDTIAFKPLSKYPTTSLDISLLVPVSCTVDGLVSCIERADKRITQVNLIDWFEKPEWRDKKSVTLRFVAYDSDGTLDKHAIDDIWSHVVHAVTALGAQVR